MLQFSLELCIITIFAEIFVNLIFLLKKRFNFSVKPGRFLSSVLLSDEKYSQKVSLGVVFVQMSTISFILLSVNAMSQGSISIYCQIRSVSTSLWKYIMKLPGSLLSLILKNKKLISEKIYYIFSKKSFSYISGKCNFYILGIKIKKKKCTSKKFLFQEMELSRSKIKKNLIFSRNWNF